LGFPAFFAMWGIVVTLLTNASGWTQESLQLGALRGAVLGFGMLVLDFASSKGWIDGTFWSQTQREAIRRRKEELERQRHDLISEFKERHHRES
jgi:hypothetical protein